MLVVCRFRKLFVLIDSCQSISLFDDVSVKNSFIVSSSLRDEHAYSCLPDAELGTSLADRFTKIVSDRLRMSPGKMLTIDMQNFFEDFDVKYMQSQIGGYSHLLGHSFTQEKLMDYLVDPHLNRNLTRQLYPANIDGTSSQATHKDALGRTPEKEYTFDVKYWRHNISK